MSAPVDLLCEECEELQDDCTCELTKCSACGDLVEEVSFYGECLDCVADRRERREAKEDYRFWTK